MVSAPGAGGVSKAEDIDPRLKDCYLGVNKYCGTSMMPMGMADPSYKQILAHHFSLVIPDYGMYMSDLQPQPGKWNFDIFDRIVDFAKASQLKVRGHALVYDYPTHRHDEKWTPTPKWVYQNHYSRADAIEIMCEHIDTVMKRYQNTVSQWIVVNEAVGNGPFGQMEDNIWLRTIGKVYRRLLVRCWVKPQKRISPNLAGVHRVRESRGSENRALKDRQGASLTRRGRYTRVFSACISGQ